MNTSELCKESNIGIFELARMINQFPYNFPKKSKRNTVSHNELIEVADVMNGRFEQTYFLKVVRK